MLLFIIIAYFPRYREFNFKDPMIIVEADVKIKLNEEILPRQ